MLRAKAKEFHDSKKWIILRKQIAEIALGGLADFTLLLPASHCFLVTAANPFRTTARFHGRRVKRKTDAVRGFANKWLGYLPLRASGQHLIQINHIGGLDHTKRKVISYFFGYTQCSGVTDWRPTFAMLGV